MGIKKYGEFLNLKNENKNSIDNIISENKTVYSGFHLINEDMSKSKKFLKERVLIRKAADELGLMTSDLKNAVRDGQKKTVVLNDFKEEDRDKIKKKMREIKIPEDKLKEIEKDQEFIRIKNLLDRNPGFLYNFVYFYYVEMISFDDLEETYNQLVKAKPVLANLEKIEEVGKKFDINFIDTDLPNEQDVRTNYEILSDGLVKLEEARLVKKLVDELPKKMRDEFKNASKIMKSKITGIAIEFNKISSEIDETGRPKKESLWKEFFGEERIDTNETRQDGSPNPNYGKKVYMSKIKEFENETNPLNKLVNVANAFLKERIKDEHDELSIMVKECNDRFGILGCDILFNKNKILILEIKSYSANVFLNSGKTEHCIVHREVHWNSYLGDYNKQYYLYNQNLPKSDSKSIIGVTIKPDGTWTGSSCQDKLNNNIYDFKDLLKSWENKYNLGTPLIEVLKPISEEEMEKRKIKKEAEREIVKRGITLEEISKLVREDGADINISKGRPLVNAIEENDYERVKFCLEVGASPNITEGANSPIMKARDLKVIKLLVDYGALMHDELLFNVLSDPDSVQYCIDAGIDPKYDSSRMYVKCFKNGYNETFNILVENGAPIRNPRNNSNMVLKWACETNNIESIEFVKKAGRIKEFDDMDWIEAIGWVSGSSLDSSKNKEREEIIQYLVDNFVETMKSYQNNRKIDLLEKAKSKSGNFSHIIDEKINAINA
jgi:hypothetical protein